MLKRSEDMAPLRSHRVHGDPKNKILLSAYEVERQAPGAQIQGLEVKTRHCSCLKNCRPDQNQERSSHL
jgi:hypothetical protein